MSDGEQLSEAAEDLYNLLDNEGRYYGFFDYGVSSEEFPEGSQLRELVDLINAKCDELRPLFDELSDLLRPFKA